VYPKQRNTGGDRQRAAGGVRAIRIVLPLPHGVVMCLYCGILPVVGRVDATPKGNTWDRAHPTLYRSDRAIQDLLRLPDRPTSNRMAAMFS